MPTIEQFAADSEIAPALLEQIRAAVEVEWPGDEQLDAASPLVDAALHPTYFVLADGGTLLSYGRTVWAYGRCDGQPLVVYGLGDVVTPRAYRRRGYAAAVVGAATAHIRAADRADIAILHTTAELKRLYARSGWAPAQGLRVVTDEPLGSTGPMLMALVLSITAQQLRANADGQVLTLEGDEW